MTPEVQQAIAEIRQAFSQHSVEIEAERQGGVYVRVQDLFLGERYLPSISWIGFTISYQYPFADVYPHYLDAELRWVDGLIKGAGLSTTTWQNKRVIQVSRRSKRWDATIDTAATKLSKVMMWLRSL